MVESLRQELDEILQGARNVTTHTDVYPPAIHQGSIYENQLDARRYFSIAVEPEAPVRA